MKKNIIISAIVLVLASFSMTSFAQTDTAQVAKDSAKVDLNKVPVYHAEKIVKLDEAGNQLKNDDGTLQYRVFLVDQFGNIRSAEAVKKQQAKVRKLVATVVGKVGLGALAGVGLQLASNAIEKKKQKAEDLLVAGAAGAIAGLAWGSDDVAKAKELKKSLKAQEKLVKEYQKSFTDEGEPRSADVDMNHVAGIEIVNNNVSKSAEEVKNLLDSGDFKEPDDSAWEI